MGSMKVVKRHPEYKYKIGECDEANRWIYINDVKKVGWERKMLVGEDRDKLSGAHELYRRIIDATGWEMVRLGFNKHRFIEDPLKLVFWADDKYGFTVILDDWKKLDKAIKFLKQFF